MVIEELAAQQAIKYEEIHQRAAQAVEALHQGTPWALDTRLGVCETDRIRDHWRKTWGRLLDTIPTSEKAAREALFREANLLPPCKEAKGFKTGSRDAAIWLSAVEFARKHPGETVYFVSANTKDFGDGASYPYPMNEDLHGITDRFVHLTSMDDIASHFTEPAAVDEALVIDILESDAVLSSIAETANTYFPPSSLHPAFECTVPMLDGGSIAIEASPWLSSDAQLGSVSDIVAYRIGDHVWCTASVEWHIVGIGYTLAGALDGAVSWSTAVLISLNREDPKLTILREALPRPVSDNVLATLDVLLPQATRFELTTAAIAHLDSPEYATRRDPSRWDRLPRGYDTDAVREALRQEWRQLRQRGESSAG